jgi:hypothetical protein
MLKDIIETIAIVGATIAALYVADRWLGCVECMYVFSAWR